MADWSTARDVARGRAPRSRVACQTCGRRCRPRPVQGAYEALPGAGIVISPQYQAKTASLAIRNGPPVPTAGLSCSAGATEREPPRTALPQPRGIATEIRSINCAAQLSNDRQHDCAERVGPSTKLLSIRQVIHLPERAPQRDISQCERSPPTEASEALPAGALFRSHPRPVRASAALADAGATASRPPPGGALLAMPRASPTFALVLQARAVCAVRPSRPCPPHRLRALVVPQSGYLEMLRALASAPLVRLCPQRS